MSYYEAILAERQIDEDEAERDEARESARADKHRAEFDALVKAGSANAPTGVAGLPTLHDVLTEVSAGSKQDTLHRAMTQALVAAASRGDPQALAALQEAQQYFVDLHT